MFTAQEYYQYNDTVGVYIWDQTNTFWYQPSNNLATLTGSFPNGVVGPSGLNNVNLNWGPGYVGGGDVRTALAQTSITNQSIGYLSFADAKSLGSSNWANVCAFNGLWPTAAGAGVRGNTVTNDFSPITLGYYSESQQHWNTLRFMTAGFLAPKGAREKTSGTDPNVVENCYTLAGGRSFWFTRLTPA